MAQEILAHTLDHTCTRKQLADFYREHAGISSIQFDVIADKPLAVLHRELQKQDLVLLYHEKSQRIVTFSLSVKCLVSTPEGLLLEVWRKHGDHEPKFKTQPWTFGGRQRRNENCDQAIRREAWGELREKLVDENLKRISPLWLSERTLRESSVWPDTLSAVMVQRYSYQKDTDLKIRTIVDGDTKIGLEVFQEVPQTALDAHFRSIDYYYSVFGKDGF